MHPPPRTTPRSGSVAALVTLAVHCLFAILLLREARPLRPATSVPRTLEGTWIHLLPLTTPVLPEPLPPEPVQEPRSSDPITLPAEQRPSTAITLAPAPSAPAPSDTGPQVESETAAQPRPWTDWQLEAEKLAARREREMFLEEEGFSGPLQKLREACKPYQSSMFPEKKPPEVPPRSWQEGATPPGSVMLGGTRVGVVGLGIPIGAKPEPNKHLFDDMMAGRTPRSSVPDPNTCD
jgi:hypothetical protein